MTSTAQNRQPKGVTIGGQFAAHQHAELAELEVSPFDAAQIEALMAEADNAFAQKQAASRRMTTRSVQATAVMVRSIYPDATEFTLEPDDEGGWSVTAGDRDFEDHSDEVWNTTRLIGAREDDFADLNGVEVGDHRGRVESVTVDIAEVLR